MNDKKICQLLSMRKDKLALCTPQCKFLQKDEICSLIELQNLLDDLSDANSQINQNINNLNESPVIQAAKTLKKRYY